MPRASVSSANVPPSRQTNNCTGSPIRATTRSWRPSPSTSAQAAPVENCPQSGTGTVVVRPAAAVTSSNVGATRVVGTIVNGCRPGVDWIAASVTSATTAKSPVSAYQREVVTATDSVA